MAKETENKSFSQTLNLPKTEFSIRAEASISEPKILDFWEQNDVYRQALERMEGLEKFVLHNGPPYANGSIHIGHVLNQTLKDIFSRARRMEGFQSFFQPGWDCHGLPIELKVIQELGWDKNPTAIDSKLLKKKCREFALHWIDRQMADLKRLGVMADWQNPYITMSKEYQAGILEVFAKFVESGTIERREKTVPWCKSCMTTLAAIEIEYKDRKDPSCYVLFKISGQENAQYFSQLNKNYPNIELSMLAWTTTPWTLPLNRAVVVKPATEYCIVKYGQNHGFVIARTLAEKTCQIMGIEPKIIYTFNSSEIKGLRVAHPINENLKIPVIFDHMVSLEEGTAVVHCAPGCGPEDYLLAKREGIEIYSPLTADGKYSSEIKPKELEGMPVVDGGWWVLKFLREQGTLLFETKITHSYPHCWRCQNGLMFRATKQWFCNINYNHTKEKVTELLNEIDFIPDYGKNRLESFVQSRNEWCLSRQRYWGVPIPALLCKNCDQSFTSKEFVLAVAKQVGQKGIEFWDDVEVDELVKIGNAPVSGACLCAKSQWIKETNILDVWFDSGSSFWAALQNDGRAGVGGQAQGLPADLYLEGSDQHRGWFQTSLFCSVIATGKPCMKKILTHGFIMDKSRAKMSKSRGNALNAQELLAQYGADILRLWVSSTDYQKDVVISEDILETSAGIFRKIRNTFRFLISNLYDYDGKVADKFELKTNDPVKSFPNFLIPHDDQFEQAQSETSAGSNIVLTACDRFILGKLLNLSRRVRAAYLEYDLTTVFSLVSNFCNNDLSAEYLDIVKDRLYVETADGNLRRSAQATIYHILDYLTHILSPVLPFLADQLFALYNKTAQTSSIHTHRFLSDQYLENLIQALDEKMSKCSEKFYHLTEKIDQAKECENFWNLTEKIRKNVLKAIEKQREQGLVKHSLEAKVTLFIETGHKDGREVVEGLYAIDKQFEGSIRFLEDFFIVSKVSLAKNDEDLQPSELEWLAIKVAPAKGSKCLRCWKWEEKGEQDLCKRCQAILEIRNNSGE